MVKLIKEFPDKPTTAAIGDGANDVSMIQEAHIGLGRIHIDTVLSSRFHEFYFYLFTPLQ